MLICWNSVETYIFELPTLYKNKIEQLFIYDKVNKGSGNSTGESADSNKVTSYEISLKHRLLLVSFQLGAIKVYKLDDTKKYVC